MIFFALPKNFSSLPISPTKSSSALFPTYGLGSSYLPNFLVLFPYPTQSFL